MCSSDLSTPDTPLADMLTHIPTAVLCGVDHPVTALPSTPATTSQAAAPQPSSAAPVHQPGFGEEIGIEKAATRTPPSGATPAREGIGTGHAAAREVIAAAQASAAADTPATMPATASASATEQGSDVQTQATPSPDAAADGVATAEAPLPAEDAGSMEATLTGVWADLLGTDDIRPDDNFFDLGGHSMLVIQPSPAWRYSPAVASTRAASSSRHWPRWPTPTKRPNPAPRPRRTYQNHKNSPAFFSGGFLLNFNQ